MLRYIIVCLSVLMWLTPLYAQEDFRKMPPKPGPAPTIDLGDYHEFTLSNGLKGIVVENHKVPRISFQIFVDLPPIKEGAYAGAADMAGDLLTRGTTTRTKAEIDEAVDFMGASLGSSASGLFGSSLTKHKETLLEIMADVLLRPAFAQEEFDKVKTQMLAGLAQSKDNPNIVSSRVGSVLRYGADHPYGETATETTVGDLDLKRTRMFYDNYFRPNTSYLVIVGDIKEKEAKRLAEVYFGKWKNGPILKEEYPAVEAPRSRKVAFVSKPGAAQSVINITYPVDLQPKAKDRMAAEVLNTLYGGFFSSRINENIREDKGYSYGVKSSLNYDKLVGSFSAGGSVRNEVTDSALVEFFAEMDRLIEEPVSDEELHLVKKVMAGQFARATERPQTMARYALNIARYDLPEDYYENYLVRLERITPKDIQMAARKYLRPDNAHLLVVGNKDISERLIQFDADGEIDYYNEYGRKQEKLAMPSASQVSAEEVIRKYIAAIGGADKLKMVKDLSIVMTTNVQGMEMELIRHYKDGDKMKMGVVLAGNPMLDTRLNGDKGYTEQMGNRQALQGEELTSLQDQALFFPELTYTDRYTLKLTGMEKLNDATVYVLEVTDKNGNTKTEYYDQTTGYKLKDVQTMESPQGTIAVVNEYSDYKVVDGIVFPHKMNSTGMMPMPLVLTTKKIEINSGLTDEDFKVD